MTLELYCLAAYLTGRRDELVRLETMLLEADRDLEHGTPAQSAATVSVAEEISIHHHCRRTSAFAGH